MRTGPGLRGWRSAKYGGWEMQKKGLLPSTEIERDAGFPDRIVIGLDEVGRGCLAGPVVVGALALPMGATEDLKSAQEGATDFAWLKEVRDSKLLSPNQRLELAPKIATWARAWAIGVATVEEIDKVNILQAVFLAMTRAVSALFEAHPVHGDAGVAWPGEVKSVGQNQLILSPAVPPCRPFQGVGVAPGAESAAASGVRILVDGNQIPPALKKLGFETKSVVKGDQKCLSVAAASVLAKVYRDQVMEATAQQFPGYGFEVHKGYSTKAHQNALLVHGVTSIHRRTFGPVAERLARGV